MRDVERLYRMALRAYPASYRAEVGEAMLGTLLEMASSGPRWVLGDLADLVFHGIGRRLGVTSPRVAGPALVRASTNGLVMAATFSVLAVAFSINAEGRVASGTWGDYRLFFMQGLVTCLVWVLVAAAALARPRWQRPGAIIGILVTIAVAATGHVQIGQFFFARPPLIILALPAALALPAVAAPAGTSRSVRWLATSVAATASVVVVTAFTLSGNSTLFSLSRWPGAVPGLRFGFYNLGFWQLTDVMVYAGAAGLLVVAVMMCRRRFDEAAAIDLLLLPWLVAGALGPRGFAWGAVAISMSTGSVIDAGLAAVAAAFALAMWGRGMRLQRRADRVMLDWLIPK